MATKKQLEVVAVVETATPTPDWKTGLVHGKQELPPRICVYGGHGIGKSTLGAAMPRPIFISTEDGIDALDVTSFPRAQTVEDVANAIKTLIKEEHDFRTLVIDSVDWLIEPLITSSVEGSHEAKDLSYGKGAMFIAEEFRELLQGLDVLRRKRHMNILLLAHAATVKYEDPRSEPYDRFQPKIPTRSNALLQEWVDVLAFAAFKVLVKKSEVGFNNTVNRGVTTGERMLHFVENPAYVAKNRYNCPDTVEMTAENLARVVPVVQ
jgi:hypothetical protein